MTIRLAVLTATAIFCVISTQAQDNNKAISAGIAVEGCFPQGRSGTVYNGAGGLLFGLSFGSGDGKLTLGTGMVFFLPAQSDQANSSSGYQIPVLIGYKYLFIHRHAFVKLELGPSQFNHFYKGDKLPSLHSWGPSYAGSVGLQFKPMEFSIKYEALAATGMDIKYYAFQVGFDF